MSISQNKTKGGRFTIKKLYCYIRKQVLFFTRFPVPLYAANAAFYIILSAFPAVMLIVGLIPYLGVSQEELLDVLSGIIPSVFEPLLNRVINDLSINSSKALISITAILALWSSARGVYCIRVGLNCMSGAREERNYLLRRIISIAYTLLFIVALLLTLVIQGFGREISNYILQGHIPILDFLVGILNFRELIVLVFLTALFAAFFCLLPNKKQPFLPALPGAALAALGWLGFTYGFSIYARFSRSYSLLYGSLSTIAMAMLWLYICICILFYGYVFNLWLQKRKK